MTSVVFSLDYEIYGSGAGSFKRLMLDPTAKLLKLFDKHGAKLTIMAEVAEILALREHAEYSDTLAAIQDQLRDAIANGHDVQLHTHPAWFDAKWEKAHWQLNFEKYALTSYSRSEILYELGRCKDFLEDLLTPVNSDYRCQAYRAGNWLLQPSKNIVSCLEELDFKIDSSVFKGGYGEVGDSILDYRNAHDELFPWTVDALDITREADRQGLSEYPIFCQEVFITSMLTMRRLKLQYRLRKDSRRTTTQGEEQLGTGKSATGVRWRFPKKFDFCRLSFREMKSFVDKANRRALAMGNTNLPVVAIGHSTEYLHDGELERFLEYLSANQGLDSTTFGQICRDVS